MWLRGVVDRNQIFAVPLSHPQRERPLNSLKHLLISEEDILTPRLIFTRSVFESNVQTKMSK
jgi:hypothetical protein